MTSVNFEPPHQDMGDHITSGIFNSGVVQTIKVLCQIGSVVILSRLLPPADFGLVAMVSPICGFVALLQDLGLTQATVQKSNLKPEEVNAFFWINIAVSTLLAAIIVAISPLIGWYYGDHRLVSLSAAMGLLLMAGCSGNQHGAILTRRMQFRVMAWTGAAGALSGLIISVAAALLLPANKGYWAIYFGMIAGTLVPVIGVWIACPWRPGLPRRVPGLGHMLRFGAGITASNVAGYVSGNADNVLIGHRWGDQLLGYYDRAYKLLLFPLLQIISPVSNTLVPVLSRLTTDPQWYRAIFLKTVGQVTLAVWPGILWAIILSDTLVPTLLGKQWQNAAPIFVPLALSGMLQVVSRMGGCLFISQGRSGDMARWSLGSMIVNVAAFVIGLPYGPVGVARAIAITSFALTPVYWWYVGRKGPVGPRAIFRAILPQMASCAVAALALIAYRHCVDAAPILLLTGGGAISYAVVAMTMALSRQGRDTLRQTVKAARRIVGHALGKDGKRRKSPKDRMRKE